MLALEVMMAVTKTPAVKIPVAKIPVATDPVVKDRETKARKPEVQRTRAWAGLIAVMSGDTAIAVGAMFGIGSSGGSQDIRIAVLTCAFTAIATLTTAYFGIRAAANSAPGS